MQLKSLTLNGFKSFADKTTIEFNHGLTGIVGPNGSGKSNITEAIRWALGEQSAKSLRGERMGDVIFAGTSARPALNRAEVTMTFDNSDDYLKNQPSEVTVTRRLFRDGESDFLINNKAVRLRDVVEMFMDSGLGRESFAFISQGRVEAIFNSKPEDRRGIFEEAAGVLKYKQQKQRAQNQLNETADNLSRVSDIVHELSSQMTPLAEQASIAQDYERQSKEYHALHQQLLALEIRDIAREQEETEQKHKQTGKALADIAQLIDKLEAQSDAATKADKTLQTTLEHLNDELLTKSMQQKELDGKNDVSSERAANAVTTMADLREQLAKAKSDEQLATERLTELTAAAATLTQKVDELSHAVQSGSAAAAELKKVKSLLEKNQAEYITALQKQADTRNDLAALEKEQQMSASQLSETQKRLADLSDQEQTLADKQQTLQADFDHAQSQSDEATAKLAQADDKRQQAAEKVNAAEGVHRSHREQYAQTKTRAAILREMSADYTGFYSGVRAVLKHKAQLPGVIGAVAELLTVPKAYQQAFDQALGGNLQAIVTTDETAAKGGIAHLKRTHSGRATFLPVSVVRPRELPFAVRTTLEQQAGFVGIASELAQFSPDVASVMQNLMGTLIVMDSLDNAVRAAGATGHRYRIVTVDGDILNAGGAMSGGSRQKGSSSPLARSQELNHLDAQLQEMKQRLETEEQELNQMHKSYSALAEQVDTLRSAVEAAGNVLRERRADLRVLEEQSKQLDRQRANLQLSMPAGSVDLASRQQKLQDTAASIKKQVESLAQAGSDLRQQQQQLEDSSAAETEHSAQLRADLAVAQTDLKTNKQQRAQWQANASENKRTISRLEQRIDAIEQSAGVTAEEKQQRKQTLAKLTAEIAALHEQQDELKQQQAESQTALSRLSARITSTYTQQKELMTVSQSQKVTLSRDKINLDNRLQTLADDYNLTYEAALAQVPAEEPEQPQLRSQIKLLRRGLDELGPVNPHAIAEYAEVKERYDFLTKQQDDLNEARSQLEATMSELDDEVRERFKDVFDGASAAFTEIFPQMFGGGHAELRLTDPEDLLTTGIEIIAQPPGKKLTRLSLLSGGERALTAITLLFAILRVRPVPFSILDEVEASLDDANVERFGEFLQNYSSETQFIVITHRRGTMVAADVLYGVTMQESGVSTMVAVTLDEAVRTKQQEQTTE